MNRPEYRKPVRTGAIEALLNGTFKAPEGVKTLRDLIKWEEAQEARELAEWETLSEQEKRSRIFEAKLDLLSRMGYLTPEERQDIAYFPYLAIPDTDKKLIVAYALSPLFEEEITPTEALDRRSKYPTTSYSFVRMTLGDGALNHIEVRGDLLELIREQQSKKMRRNLDLATTYVGSKRRRVREQLLERLRATAPDRAEEIAEEIELYTLNGYQIHQRGAEGIAEALPVLFDTISDLYNNPTTTEVESKLEEALTLIAPEARN